MQKALYDLFVLSSYVLHLWIELSHLLTSGNWGKIIIFGLFSIWICQTMIDSGFQVWVYFGLADFKNDELEALPLNVLCFMNLMIHPWMMWTYCIYVLLRAINLFCLVCAVNCWLCIDVLLLSSILFYMMKAFGTFFSIIFLNLSLLILVFYASVLFILYHSVLVPCKSISIYLWVLQERESYFLNLQKLPSGFSGVNNDSLNSVNKLCDCWSKHQSVVIIDDQVRLSVAR